MAISVQVPQARVLAIIDAYVRRDDARYGAKLRGGVAAAGRLNTHRTAHAHSRTLASSPALRKAWAAAARVALKQ